MAGTNTSIYNRKKTVQIIIWEKEKKMTGIIIEKRKKLPNEFDYSPINQLSYRTLHELFNYIDQNSNLKIIDVSSETIGSRLCFRVVDKDNE